jgi:hypothetical protein
MIGNVGNQGNTSKETGVDPWKKEKLYLYIPLLIYNPQMSHIQSQHLSLRVPPDVNPQTQTAAIPVTLFNKTYNLVQSARRPLVGRHKDVQQVRACLPERARRGRCGHGLTGPPSLVLAGGVAISAHSLAGHAPSRCDCGYFYRRNRSR